MKTIYIWRRRRKKGHIAAGNVSVKRQAGFQKTNSAVDFLFAILQALFMSGWLPRRTSNFYAVNLFLPSRCQKQVADTLCRRSICNSVPQLYVPSPEALTRVRGMLLNTSQRFLQKVETITTQVWGESRIQDIYSSLAKDSHPLTSERLQK